MEKIIGQIRNILRKEGITGMDSINQRRMQDFISPYENTNIVSPFWPPMVGPEGEKIQFC